MTLYELLYSPMFKIRANKQKLCLSNVYERGAPYVYGEYIDCERFRESYFSHILSSIELIGSFDKLNLFYEEGYYLNTPSHIKSYEMSFYIRVGNSDFEMSEDLFTITIYDDGENIKYKLNLGKTESFNFEVSLRWMANEIGEPALAELPREWVEKVYYITFPYHLFLE